MRIRRRRLAGGIALTAVIALASTLAATSVRADRAHPGNGALAGGIIGGLIGSTIGKGNGRLVAVGAGALLGSLYGQQLAAHPHPARGHVRPPPPRHRQWHGHRVHRHPPHVYLPPRHHRHGHAWKPPHIYAPVAPHRYGWRRPHVHAPVVLYPGHPQPRHATRHRHAPRRHAFTECRLLQHGAPPVVACRTANGAWRIRN